MTAPLVRQMVEFWYESTARYPWWPWEWHMDALKQWWQNEHEVTSDDAG